jgi:hypothetical protein
MNRHLTSRVLIALAAIGSIHQAQVPTKQAPKATEASLTAEPDLSWRFAVAGLTKDNAAAIKTALSGITATAYVCDPCAVEQMKAGTCPKCSAQLQMAKKPVFASVSPSPDDSSLNLSLIQRRPTRLSEIEAALKKSSVTIDYAKMPLVGRVTFIAKGGTAEKLAATKKALADTAQFEEIQAALDPATAEMRFTTKAKASPAPTDALVAKTFEAQKVQLADILFGKVLEAPSAY